MSPLVDRCAAAGFDAVDIDDLDSWQRFPQIAKAGARELARSYIDLAHRRGMAIEQMNAARLYAPLPFEVAVVESCDVWDECVAYRDVHSDHVSQIEYPEELASIGRSFAESCSAPDRAPITILRDRSLLARDQPGHLYERW